MTHEQETRIDAQDSLVGNIAILCNGNPGALSCLIDLCTNWQKIDPDSFLGPWTPLVNLDTFQIYGPAIYLLWNDLCGRDMYRMALLLRACQLGIINRAAIKFTDDGRSHIEPLTFEVFQAYERKVREVVPSFGLLVGGLC